MGIVDLTRAVELLRAGEAIAYPTETFYGLGVDARMSQALQRLDSIKQRPHDKSYPVLIPSVAYLRSVATLSSRTENLVRTFWPGPLTIVLPATNQSLPFASSDGTIGVRMSRHPIAQQLVHLFDGPITSTSANLSHAAPADTPATVASYFPDLSLIDAGKTPGGPASTVVKVNDDQLELLRLGAIAFDDIVTVFNSGR